MYDDGLLATSIILMNCTLDDTRHSRQGSLTRIMERTSEVPDMGEIAYEKEKSPVRSMLDMTIRMGPRDIFGELNLKVLLISLLFFILFFNKL